jgi:hypothetical protein
VVRLIMDDHTRRLPIAIDDVDDVELQVGAIEA